MNSREKYFFIFLLSGVLIFIILVFTGVGVYALCFSNDNMETTNVSTRKNNLNKDNQEENNENLDNTKENKNTVEENETDSEEKTNNNDNLENKTALYTAKDGTSYETVGTVNIPSLNIKYPILSEYSEELMKVSVTKYWGAYPNEVGNLCILGHNYKNSKFFGRLLEIQKNDIIEITDVSGRKLEYKVYETGIVEPENTACTSQLTDGHTEVTLITCYYENGEAHASKRFYAKARAN